MTNIMQAGEDFLDSKLFSFASEVVVYCKRGASTSKDVKAVVGKSFFRGDAVGGLSVYTRTVDFIISVTELGYEPSNGDTILRGGQVFEVFEPNNEPCWRYSGGNHAMYRIHTHAIASDNESLSLSEEDTSDESDS